MPDQGLLFVFFRQSCSYFTVSAFSWCQNRPRMKIAVRWRRRAEAIWLCDRPTLVCCKCSVDTNRPSFTVFQVISTFRWNEIKPEAEIAVKWCRQSEVVWPFDGQIRIRCFDLYTIPLCILPLPGFRDFCDFSQIWPAVVSASIGVADRKWHHHSIMRPHFCTRGLLTCFICFFSFKSYTTFSFWIKIAIDWNFWGYSWRITEVPIKHILTSSRVVWAIERVCATLSSTSKRFREKYFQKYQKESQSPYVSHVHEGASIHPVGKIVCIFVKVSKVMKRANLGGCMWRGFVSAKGRF